MERNISANISVHNPFVAQVRRHEDTGTLAVTVGDWPTQVVLYFDDNAEFEAFVAPVQAFIDNEATVPGQRVS